jgi:hypothetical protein
MILEYLKQKNFEPVSLDIFENNSWQSIGLTLNGNGCYYIAIGHIFEGHITCNVSYFDKLNKSNILEFTKVNHK